MRKERQAGSLDTGIETYRSIEFNLIGDQFKEYRDLDHAGKPLQIPNFGASIEGYTSGFNLNLHDCWNPLQGSSVYHDSKTHDFFDRYSSKRPDRSHTWSGEYSDPGYGSQFGGGTTPSMSVSSFLDSRTEISSIPDDSSSYINGVAIPRQSRTKSLDDNKLRCDKCPWVGKTPSEKRKHDARHRKAHKCEEDGCESRFGNKNDLERHRKSVHNKCPECGPKETYKCFGRNCGHPEKVWPRLDNFKAHLRLKHYEENETDLLSWSRNWYKERKKEEEGKKREGGIQTTSSCTADVSSRKEPPTTPTITPSTLINTLSYNPGDYFGTELGTLTLNPIGHPQNSRANAFPETLQTLNELPFSPLKADGSSADQVDFKLPSVPDILAEVNPQRRDDLVFRMGPESTPSKGGLPGVELFHHGVPSTKVLDLAVKLQNRMRGFSQEERDIICLKLESIWEEMRTPDTSKSWEDPLGKRDEEIATTMHEMSKESPKQDDSKCPFCFKSFNRPSALKKHRKRHEKPYGCTFSGCYGRFGSKADWKRHESMQHCHTQSFRCSLPRDPHPQCAKLFLQQKDFVEHLRTVHHAEPGTIDHQITNGRIGANDAESKFRYWCGFCKEIKPVEKTGVDALNERFDHIDLHFRRNENIKTWIPAKGHTEKGAQKKRDKNRKKESKRTATSRLEENPESLYDNGHDCGEPSTYEECPSSADETYTEAKPHSDSHGERSKARKLDHVEKHEDSVFYCCSCGDGPRPIMAMHCVCGHPFCEFCNKETSNIMDPIPPFNS
ncbi:hypothetical protein EYB25_006549 [Talaromyces marneffei]|nr:hypothetical protein EYB25_006549 [Talaromyces marneffei]